MTSTNRRSGPRALNRRQFLTLVGSSASALLLANCSTPAAPLPPTAAPKPAAPAPPPPTVLAMPTAHPTVVPAEVTKAAASVTIGPAEKAKVVMAMASPTYQSQAALFIAMDKGFFKDEGLELQIVDSEDGIPGAVGGSIDIVHNDTGPIVETIRADVAAKVISPWRTSENFMYAVRDNIKTAADMDGKTMINETMGSRYFELVLGFMKESGFDTSKVNVNWVNPAGSSDGKVEMFIDGKVEGTYLYPRHIEGISAAGGRVMYQTYKHWPQEALMATQAFIDKNPNTLTRFFRATIRGMQIWCDVKNKDYVIKLMESKGFKIPDAYKRAYDLEPAQMSSDMGFDPETMTEILAASIDNPPPFATYFDGRFLNAAQKSLGLPTHPAP